MQFLFLAIKGIAIGVANIVPGVSGATLAVIFRVYDKLIESINSLFTDTKNALKFLIPLGLGMLVGIIALGSLLDYFIETFSLQTGAFIAGLVAGGVPFIHNLAVQEKGKRKYLYIISAIAALIIIALSVFAPTPELYVSEQLNVGLTILLFFGGFLAAAAMIIPGVSGAMVLILMGVYPLAMHTISLIRDYLITPFNFELLPPILMVVVPVGLGVALGILLTSRLIAYLLEKHQSTTYFAILGLIFGTIFVVFNDDATYQSHDGITPMLVVFAAIAFAAGMAISLVLGKRK